VCVCVSCTLKHLLPERPFGLTATFVDGTRTFFLWDFQDGVQSLTNRRVYCAAVGCLPVVGVCVRARCCSTHRSLSKVNPSSHLSLSAPSQCPAIAPCNLLVFNLRSRDKSHCLFRSVCVCVCVCVCVHYGSHLQ